MSVCIWTFNHPEVQVLFTKKGHSVHPTGSDNSCQNSPVEQGHRTCANTVCHFSLVQTSVSNSGPVPSIMCSVSPAPCQNHLDHSHQLLLQLGSPKTSLTFEPLGVKSGFKHQDVALTRCAPTPEKASSLGEFPPCNVHCPLV